MRSSDHDRVVLFPLGFRRDPRIRGLTDAEYRAWTEVLFDQLEYGNGTPELRSVLSARRLQRFLDLGLLTDEDGRIYVTTWDEWNGRAAWKRYLNRQRQQRFRDKKRNA